MCDNIKETYCFEDYTLNRCELSIKGFANSHNMRNTLIALSVSKKLHNGQFRDGGLPYVIHPLTVTKFLIDLEIDKELKNWYNMSYDKIYRFMDILCASSILHDVIEDCSISNDGKELVSTFHLDEEVRKTVFLLSKDKEKEKLDKISYSKEYYQNILFSNAATLIKISDRTNNCSTIDVFTKERMIKYVTETKEYIYPLCNYLRDYNPEFSRPVTIMKYLIVSVCETIASKLKVPDIISTDPNKYQATYFFILYYAKGKMPNTVTALALAKKYHTGQFRKTGDPFILHPLRVCSHLINLGIDDDDVCAAALLHEITKRCTLPDNWETIFINQYGLSQNVIDLIHLVANTKNLSKDEYYIELSGSPEAVLIKLANRAHTCTRLCDFNNHQISDYIQENFEFLFSVANEISDLYHKYTDAITLSKYHITAVCNVANRLKDM